MKHTWRRRKYPGVSLPSLMIMSVGGVVWIETEGRAGWLSRPAEEKKQNKENSLDNAAADRKKTLTEDLPTSE